MLLQNRLHDLREQAGMDVPPPAAISLRPGDCLEGQCGIQQRTRALREKVHVRCSPSSLGGSGLDLGGLDHGGQDPYQDADGSAKGLVLLSVC
jgi:hypothetical protein